MGSKTPGFLVSGLVGQEWVGYLFVPLSSIAVPLQSEPNVFALSSAVDGEAFWVPRSILDPFDQPVRFVGNFPEGLLNERERATVIEVRYSVLDLFRDNLRIVAERNVGGRVIVATAIEAPSDIEGRPKGTLLEFYDDFGAVDHRSWRERRRTPVPSAA